MTDYEQIRDTVLGYLEEDARLSWADCAAEEGSDLDRAYQQLAAARESLCRRFAIKESDGDLERMMDAVLLLERAVARGMFDAAQAYAKRGYRI